MFSFPAWLVNHSFKKPEVWQIVALNLFECEYFDSSEKLLAKVSIIECVNERIDSRIAAGHKHEYVNG